ncbi:amino acid adenylation domain-containing protein (plasmid) [Bradyrhizobium sp. Pa8]|uniref:amino acid adenylation domain-containing protein n=1 Tax=Bradyrhizobium sp. Pa8 TaxID=3386552 RepID=UPI00403F9634
MNIINLVEEVEALGVELSCEGDQLRFRAPQGGMTSELKHRLSTNKSAILQHLSEDGASSELVVDVAGRHQPFPLTEAQSAYFLGRHSSFEYGGVACRGYLEIAYPPQTSPQVLDHAWQDLVRRHDVLRIIIEDEGYQQVLEEVEPRPLPVDDLTSLSDTQVERHVERLREQMLSAPVNYARWPLFDVRLCRCRHQTVLLLAIELILVDAASLYLLIDDLDELVSGAGLAPVPAVTFRDYVIARRAQRQGRRYRRDRNYWLSRLESLPPAPELPMAAALPLAAAADSGRFSRRALPLTAVQSGRLSAQAAARGTTLNALMLGAFAEVLGVWSRSRRFTLNLPIFRREPLHPDIDAVIGDFTSVTLLEIDLDAAQTFGDRVQAIGRQLFDDLDHAAFSGLEMLGELSRRRGASVLMPVVFTSTAGGAPARRGQQAGYRILRGLTQTPQVSLDCQITEQPDGLLIAWDVRDGLFPPDIIDQMFAAFRGLVERLADNDTASRDEAHLVTLPEAQAAVRHSVNATGWQHADALLHRALVAQAEQHPERPALYDNRGCVTYGEWLTAAQALAAGLVAAGCRPGERVAILCAKGRMQAIAPLAVLLCGGCYVPVDVDQPLARRSAILSDAGIRLAIADPGCELPAPVVAVQADYNRMPPLPVQAVSPEAPAYVIYTSGSTGTPKGVVISHAAAWNTVADINQRFGITADDRVLALASLGFDLSVYDLFGIPAAGGALVYPDEARKTDPSHWAQLVAQYSVTLWNTVPAQLQMLCDAADGGAQAPSHLRLALVSGDWVPVDLKSRLERYSPAAQLISLGGATEAAIWSIYHPVTAIEGHWSSIPYGRPLANQRMHIVDSHLRERPDWVVGQIAISGHGLALGYLNDPDKTARQFVTCDSGERLYLTGDLGRYWPDGTLEFLGRQDSQVKIRGHRVELGEIAGVLRTHPAVGDAQVLLSTESTGKMLCAFVEPGRNDQPVAHAVMGTLHQRAAAIEHEIDGDAFAALMRGADQVAILAMAARLRGDGLFATPEARHDLTHIYQATGVAAVHQWLLRRWLDGLVDARALSCDDGLYHSLIAADDATVREVWAEVDHLERKAAYGSQTLHYIRVCSDQLSGLLRGEVDVRAILFPQGELGTAHAAYRDNLVSQSMNGMVVAVVRALAEDRKRRDEAPLRVLEVGAGVAGTASDLVPALAEFTPEYWFTDLSEFFLTEARRLFADYPWMNYGIFDMNEDARLQGMAPNSFDVILCANVLHNARHAGDVLRQFTTLLAPGGCVVFIEPFRRHNYPLLVSMEFFPELTGFRDLRADTDQTFFTREQWLTWLREAGALIADCAPAASSNLATAGQGVFVGQFKTDRSLLRVDDLCGFLRDRLPGYMVPAQIQVLDALPRLGSGKSDRAALQGLVQPARQRPGSAGLSGAAPRDALEQQIADVWGHVLGVAQPACEIDFYALGGDSLLLSRMIARLRQQLPAAAELEWEVLLRHLLREPTIRALAERLRHAREQPAALHSRSALVPLWGDEAVEGRCCVFVHAGTGNLLPYQHLLQVLDKTAWPRGIGVELPQHEAFTDLTPDRALTRLAARYADELTRRGDEFTLIGYCLGGLLAAEIARMLTEQGKRVTELVAISAYQPPHVEADALVDYIFARALGASPQRLALPEERALAAAVAEILQAGPGGIARDAFERLGDRHREVKESFAAWSSRSLAQRLAQLRAGGHADGIYHQPDGAGLEFARQHALFAHSMASVGLHRGDAWLGRTVLLRNSASDPLLPGTPQDVAGYWQNICLGDLVIADIAGDHFSCLSRVHAPRLAELIVQHIHRAGV